jgi:hypothetical protein
VRSSAQAGVESKLSKGVNNMPEPQIQEVFKTSGVPTYTFVHPLEYPRLLLNLRTPGRGLVVEGPSGIGKTTAVENALVELGLSGSVTKLSARLPEDIEYIAELPAMGKVGTVIVDDFHKLPETARQALGKRSQGINAREQSMLGLACSL